MISQAQKEQLATALTWPQNAAQFRFWFGDKIAYGSSVETVWEQIQASYRETYAFMDNGNFLGFGQCYQREAGSRHIACLIVAPEARGKGYGRQFVSELMRHALADASVQYLTLNVYAENRPAHALYQSLGFDAAGKTRGMIAMRYERSRGLNP